MVDPDPTPRRRRLDGRTIGICVCIALIAALAAALVASIVIDDTDSDATTPKTGRMEVSPADVDGNELLAVKLTTPAGKETTLGRSITDKPVLVNLWQQSCVPCVDEMPLLEQLNQTEKRVEVIGVDTQDRPELARKMVKRTGITYPWVQDPGGDFFYAAESVGLPASLLVDTDGKVLATKTGAFKSRGELDRWLATYLD